jgi:hypothetical protein
MMTLEHASSEVLTGEMKGAGAPATAMDLMGLMGLMWLPQRQVHAPLRNFLRVGARKKGNRCRGCVSGRGAWRRDHDN